METLLTFDQVIHRANKPHLLLGNGFSIAYDSKRFSFTNLFDSAVEQNIISKESELYKLFDKLNTADFESVMRLLDESVKVVESYTSDKTLVEKIKSDTSTLKNHLVQIITNNHPEKSSDVTETEKQNCLFFLSKFEGKIYTINYDLLLYWCIVTDIASRYTDGFGDTEDSLEEAYVVYQNNPKKSFNVHFLHGGLHIYDADDEIIKHTYNNSEINLIDQTRQSLEEGKYPVFISEGSSAQKHAKIIHNAYLNHCYRSLKTITGDLVIFGTLLKKNDQHILNAIMSSAIKNIYLGVSNLASATHIQTQIDSFNSNTTEKKKKSLFFYDYKTVDVWGR